ncbi:uncharacterized protein CcaverHIS019_0400690 [Cutaneotrichosporon cavernicola]|uniref:Ricin B lectin domain-containing protein n=1 Tax=Cutaneotrichosporon cavernicola TaxID=279322 RepID=A0AA48L3F2_9TREE|nr:uncharacterized protein CcaverHIS019_0400690 [Cutaneotrichosporon cavernicola]BEI91249.1 hypothetical protein CcaverHIS019_0400690 [Cutaneotrichosporon cavernicola]BEI99022.1 hypothetical protein CcaverHIS631_0400650 [Cutaneotrichosporon cavernicola]BEJ06796.1 hypothetical protein CcaverHIS641_0400650 [Cutaneotrichosporon cavernicola]
MLFLATLALLAPALASSIKWAGAPGVCLESFRLGNKDTLVVEGCGTGPEQQFELSHGPTRVKMASKDLCLDAGDAMSERPPQKRARTNKQAGGKPKPNAKSNAKLKPKPKPKPKQPQPAKASAAQPSPRSKVRRAAQKAKRARSSSGSLASGSEGTPVEEASPEGDVLEGDAPEGEREVAVKEPGSASKNRRRRKKGKVFLEDKAGLLGLISDVTDSKAAIVEDKLKREAAREAAATEREEKRERGKKGRKADERKKALDAAKEAIVAREKAKKARRREPRPAEAEPKKRVGFA